MSIAEKLVTIAQNELEIYNSGKFAAVEDTEEFIGKPTGTQLIIDDVSPVEHLIDIQLTSKNLLNLEGREVVNFGASANTTKRVFPNGKGIILRYNRTNIYNGQNVVDDFTVTKDAVSYEQQSPYFGIGFDVKLNPNTQYVFSCIETAKYSVWFTEYDADGNYILATSLLNAANGTITTKSETDWGVISFATSGGVVGGTNLQLEYGTTATPYTPYIEDFSAIPATTNLVANGFTDNQYGMAQSVDNFTLEYDKTYKIETTTTDGAYSGGFYLAFDDWDGNSNPPQSIGDNEEFKATQSGEFALFSYNSASYFASVSLIEVGATKPAVVEVGGTNLFDVSKVKDESEYLTINNDGTITISGSGYASAYATLRELCPSLKVGDTVVFSMVTTGRQIMYLQKAAIVWNNGKTYTITEDMLNSFITLYGNTDNGTYTISQIWINYGTTALPYEPYKPTQKYEVDSESKAKNIKTLYPTMVITSDTESAVVSTSYIKDIDKVFQNLSINVALSEGE
jgi:hypothetical protein